MAGIFAPTLSDIGSAPRPSGNISTAIGLEGIAGIIDTGLRASEREKPSQTDRDREALAPFIDDAILLQEQRAAGLSDTEFRARQSVLTNQAIAALPDKADLIRKTFGGIFGQEVQGEIEDPILAVERGIVTRLQSTDPEDQLATLRAYGKAVVNGRVDGDLLIRAAAEEFSMIDAEKAQLERLKREREVLQQGNLITEETQNAVAQDRLAVWGQNSQALVQGLLARYFGADGEGSEVPPERRLTKDQLATSLIQLRANVLNQVGLEARDLGIVDNLKTLVGGLDAAVAPIDNLIEMVNSMDERTIKELQVMEAESAKDFGQFINTVTGTNFGNDKNLKDMAGLLLAEAFLPEMKVAVKNLSAAVRKGGKISFGVGPDGAISFSAAEKNNSDISTPEAKEVASRLSESELRDQLNLGLKAFEAYGAKGEITEFDTKVAVDELTMGLEALNNRGLPASESTFDAIFTENFFATYNNVQALGGPSATQLENVVAVTLANMLIQRRDLARVSIEEIGTGSMPSKSIVFNGEKYEVVLDTPRTQFEAFVQKEMKKKGLPLTLEGLKEFSVKFGFELSEGDEVARIVTALSRRIEPDIRLLNKLVSTTKRFPEDMQQRISPKKETVNTKIVETSEDFENLEEGDSYQVMYNDGRPRTFVRGQEPWLSTIGETR